MIKRFLFLSLLALTACKDRQTDPCASSFDQSAMLQNLGNNIILPRYQALANNTSTLHNKIEAFTLNPAPTTLAEARAAFQSAYLSYQRAAITQFGPAETQLLRQNLNSFPLFSARLNATIADSSSYDLNQPYHQFAKGFPAIDYMLHGLANTDTDIIAAFSSAPEANARQQYLLAVSQNINAKANTVYDAWRTDNGNYLLTFTSSTGVATGTSTSFIINQLSQNYELVKNEKIGTPIGAKVSYIPSPEKVEARYSGISLDLALEAVDASKDLFLGLHETTNADGQSLDDYLNAVETERGETATPLATTITQQFDLATQQLESIRTLGTLQQAITNDINAVKVPYAAVVNQIVYIKTDLPSLLCVSITYSDITDDGD